MKEVSKPHAAFGKRVLNMQPNGVERNAELFGSDMKYQQNIAIYFEPYIAIGDPLGKECAILIRASDRHRMAKTGLRLWRTGFGSVCE